MEAVPNTSTRAAGRFQRALERFIEAREAQGRRRVLDYLITLSDERLAGLGYTDEQIRQIRFERKLPSPNAE
jgi:hypothetical protein